MSSPTTPVAIVGAGPNGLALSAHLRAAGADHVVLGDPLVAWRAHMPAGTRLKSEPYGSSIAAPEAGFALADFCRSANLPYDDRELPVAIETFVAYGDWYRGHLVEDVWQAQVRHLERSASGFLLRTDDEVELHASSVVVATGLLPFAHLPEVLAGLPSHYRSHAWDHADLRSLVGRRVAVVGAGQSALETAALAHEAGADVEILTRRPQLYFSGRYPARIGLLSTLRRPASPTCEGWPCWCYHHLPDVFRAMPAAWRTDKAFGFLGPGGSWWLRERVENRIPMRTGVRILAATPLGDRVRLELVGAAGGSVIYDHVIAGTGYRMDLDRLGFLDPRLRSALRRSGGGPLVNRHFESTVPGLHFVGAMAAPSLGPSMRFLAGTGFTARRLTATFRRQRPRRRGAGHPPLEPSGRRPDASWS